MNLESTKIKRELVIVIINNFIVHNKGLKRTFILLTVLLRERSVYYKELLNKYLVNNHLVNYYAT